MATTPLVSKIRGVSEYNTADITALGKSLLRPYTPAIGGGGLRLDEIERALIAMRYEPRIWAYPTANFLIHTCHVYIESGLSPVLIIYFPLRNINGVRIPETRHAVTAIGYTVDTSCLQRNDPIDSGIYASTEFLHNLIVNNDQAGMYLPVEIKARAEDELRGIGVVEAIVEFPHINGYKGYCEAILVPFPHRVMLKGDAAVEKAESWIQCFRLQEWVENKDLVIHPFLVRSNLYKEAFLKRDSVPPDLKAIYRSLPMPRYIWVVEYGYIDDWYGSNSAKVTL
jgi:hypothetical protein